MPCNTTPTEDIDRKRKRDKKINERRNKDVTVTVDAAMYSRNQNISEKIENEKKWRGRER